jgi:Protein of unknown function (DUF3179)
MLSKISILVAPEKIWSTFRFLSNGKFLYAFFLGSYGSHLSPFLWVRWLKWRRQSQGKFDQLFVPLDQPATLRSGNFGEIEENEIVMGVVVEGRAKAYPTSILAFHHIIQHQVGGRPLLITFCGRCHSGVVFDPVVKGRLLKFVPHGLRHGSMMMRDKETGSIWSHVTGEAVEGPHKGVSLDIISSNQVTWKEWLKSYPQTLLIAPHPDYAWLYHSSKLSEDHRTISDLVGFNENSPLPPNAPGYGVSRKGGALFISLERLSVLKVMTGKIGEEELVSLYHGESFGGGVYSPMVKGLQLTFKVLEEDLFKDEQTGSIWNCFGLATQGPLEGTALKNFNAVTLQWYAWQGWYPQSLTIA